MDKFEEVKRMILEMTPTERRAVLYWLGKDLGETTPGIKKTVGVVGGRARIRDSRISVWGLEQFRRLGGTEAELLSSYPTLTVEDLVNAWAYVRANKDEIDRDIEENERD